MPLSCGIVGLPNVGKSTLFNALTRSQVPTENYPFCTIEPNRAIVSVPDERVRRLAELNKSQKLIYTALEVVDIAGLVKGAAKGEGLGNQFIAHIKAVDAIAHVVRLFEDSNVLIGDPSSAKLQGSHKNGQMLDPIAALETIHHELILYDLVQCEKRLTTLTKAATRNRDNTPVANTSALKKALACLNQAKLLSSARASFTSDELQALKKEQFVTLKPLFIIGNIKEAEVSAPAKNNPHYNAVKAYTAEHNFPFIELSAELEREVSDVGESLLEETISPYLKAVELKQSGCARLVKTSYQMLELITFFTSGESETRAWTLHANTLAPKAAAAIHSDIQRGFIKVEIISTKELLRLGSYKRAREEGKLRIEGKNYIIADGDVCHFKFNL